MKIFIQNNEDNIKTLNKETFYSLLFSLKKLNLDSDSVSSEKLSYRLKTEIIFSPDEFAKECNYVILASGFSQQTAKRKWLEIQEALESGKNTYEDIIKIFGNKNKVNAIIKIWNNRYEYQRNFYKIPSKNIAQKLKYLETFPHIGATTKNHLARNLGTNLVKYDIWIQRLAISLNNPDLSKADTDKLIKFPVSKKIKTLCDQIFTQLEKETGEGIGFLDMIIWKSCQQSLINFK